VLPRNADLGLEVSPMPLQFQYYRRQLDRLGPGSDNDQYFFTFVRIQDFHLDFLKTHERAGISTASLLACSIVAGVRSGFGPWCKTQRKTEVTDRAFASQVRHS
jgi:hypothetical protein